MNILDKIVADKREEIKIKKEILPIEILELLPSFNRKCLSLSRNLKNSNSGIIAEFKRKSPSIPKLNLDANIEDVALEYQHGGVSGISILTDEIYFGGLNDDILLVREMLETPILRKDFIIDEYQIFEAKAIGADVILLIASILSEKEIQQFSKSAKELGLEVLLEIHNEQELQKSLTPNIDMVGVNNRNLKTFEVDLNTSKSLSEKIPNEFVKISESGISNIEAIKELRTYGFRGFLIGENFMKTKNPGKAAEEFIKQLKRK